MDLMRPLLEGWLMTGIQGSFTTATTNNLLTAK